MLIRIASLSAARRHKRQFDAVLSIESPHCRPTDQLRFRKFPAPDHLVLKFEDLDEATGRVTMPTVSDAEKILAFGRKHANSRLILHCAAGIGRSGAAGLIILADRLGPGREQEAIEAMLKIRPEAVPNLALVRAGDEVLGRSGRLTKAVLEENERRPNWRLIRARKAELFQRNPALFF